MEDGKLKVSSEDCPQNGKEYFRNMRLSRNPQRLDNRVDDLLLLKGKLITTLLLIGLLAKSLEELISAGILVQ